MDWLYLLVVQGTLKSLLQHHNSKALSLCYGPSVTSIHDYWKNQYFDSMKCRGRSALRDPICYSFLLCAVSQGFSIPYQFLENRNEQNCMQFWRLRSWEGAPAWIPFRDSLQWLPSVALLKCNLFIYAPLTQDMECFLALWRLLFAWLCFCSVFFFFTACSCLVWRYINMHFCK